MTLHEVSCLPYELSKHVLALKAIHVRLGGPLCLSLGVPNLVAVPHADVRQSPCWRKGPSDGLNGKQTLCNACGSRYLVRRATPDALTSRKLWVGFRFVLDIRNEEHVGPGAKLRVFIRVLLSRRRPKEQLAFKATCLD